MRKLNQFLRNCDLIKGRKPAPPGTLSKDGKKRKAVDGTWKPVKKQRTSSPTGKWRLSYFDEKSNEWTVKRFTTEREAVDAQNEHGGDLEGGGKTKMKKQKAKFLTGPGSRAVSFNKEIIANRMDAIAEAKRKGFENYQPTQFGKPIKTTREEFQNDIARAESIVKQAKKELKLATIAEGAFRKLEAMSAGKIPSQLMIEHSAPGRLALTGNSGQATYVQAKPRDTVDGFFERAITFINGNYMENP